LRAWDPAAGSYVELARGASLGNYRIHRHTQPEIDGGAPPYAMRFECNGGEYSCPLSAFQTRTRAVEPGHTAGAIAV
jgi:hypothetical protein